MLLPDGENRTFQLTAENETVASILTQTRQPLDERGFRHRRCKECILHRIKTSSEKIHAPAADSKLGPQNVGL